MQPLTIELAKGEKKALQSLGWKIQKAGEMPVQLYGLNDTNTPMLLTLKPAIPECWMPGYPVAAIRDPFPEAVCVEISPCRLLAPPCYESRQEFESSLSGHYVFEPWRATYCDTHQQVLILDPTAYPFLQDRLDKWLIAMRAEYEREARAWCKKIDRLKTATLVELGIETEEERALQVIECQEQLGIVESESPINGVPCKGRLSLTLTGVKRGHEGIRDSYMHEEWARKNGEDLVVMSRERRVFRKWLVSHTGTPADVFNARTRQLTQTISPPDLGENFESNPQFLEACAKVRYRARFADNTGTIVYLADCELRGELNRLELDEVARLRGFTALAEPIAAVQMATKQMTDAAEAAAMAGQQARADVEAGASTLGARTKDLAETLGKVAEVFADPLVAAAKDASIKRGVPEVFAWWVFQKWHSDKFPTVDGAFKGSRLGPKLKEAGLAFSRATVHRWITIIREELVKRGLVQKRRLGRGAVKSPNLDVAQAQDTGPLPGEVNEPPEEFVRWVEDQDAAGAMPTIDHVLARVRAHADKLGLATFSDADLKDVAAKWLTKALEILDTAPTNDATDDNRNVPQDGD